MQQSAATSTSTITYRRRVHESAYNHPRSYVPSSTRTLVCSAVPQLVDQSTHDFYLDTFFNPLWMPGPHVFSLAKDAAPETSSAEPCPGHWMSTVSSLLSSPHSTPSTSPRAYSSSKASDRVDKPWKNVAITEQDDEEFAKMEAKAEVRARAEAKAKLVGLVYTWPPPPPPALCPECEVLLPPRPKVVLGTGAASLPREGAKAATRTGTPESSAPALSYGSSRESEYESEVFKVVPGRRALGRSRNVPFEKRIGFGRVARKTTAAKPRMFAGIEEEYGISGWPCFEPLRSEVGKVDDFWNPFIPEVWVEDELTANLKALLRMPNM